MAYERGASSYAQLAALLQVQHRTLERWVARWRTARSVELRPPASLLAFVDRSECAVGPSPRGAGCYVGTTTQVGTGISGSPKVRVGAEIGRTCLQATKKSLGCDG